MAAMRFLKSEWDFTVSAKHNLLDIRLRELVRYRDLILMFFIRDFTTTYKQTILGPLWYVINPLCSTLVYAFVFGNVAGIGTDGVPSLLFYYSGTMLWSYFSSCLNGASTIFLVNAPVFSKIYFPRLSAPIAVVFSAIFKMLVQFVMLIAFFFYYISTGSPIRPSLMAFYFPLIVLWLGALGVGLGMIVSALTTRYRDLNHVLTLALQLAMYVTPVIYPLSQVPPRFRAFFFVNPVSAPMELFRIWFYGTGQVPYMMTAASIGITAMTLLLGLMLFTRNERTFMDVI
jgi:lipopolysaccharide transport system permease protein